MNLIDSDQLPFELGLGHMGYLFTFARENLGLSLRELASLAHVSPAQMIRIEKGETDYSIGTFWRICGVLGIPALDALNWGIQSKDQTKFPINEPDPDIEEAVRQAKESNIDEVTARENIHDFIVTECWRTAWLLTMPDGAFIQLQPSKDSVIPKTPLGIARMNLCKSVFHLDNSDRALAVSSLLKTPLRRLKSYGLVSIEILQQAAGEKHGPFELRPTVDSIENLIQSNLRNKREKQSSVDIKEDSIQSPSNPRTDPVNLEELIQRLQKVLAPRGRKSELAREFGISRQAVDNWLKGKTYPKSEAVLRLLEWVQVEEAKQKSSVGALTPAEPKTTRTRKQSNETKSESNPREP